MVSRKAYTMELIDLVYGKVPAFTDIFDEETWYIFVGCFVALTITAVFIISRFVTIKPVEP